MKILVLIIGLTQSVVASIPSFDRLCAPVTTPENVYAEMTPDCAEIERMFDQQEVQNVRTFPRRYRKLFAFDFIVPDGDLRFKKYFIKEFINYYSSVVVSYMKYKDEEQSRLEHLGNFTMSNDIESTIVSEIMDIMNKFTIELEDEFVSFADENAEVFSANTLRIFSTGETQLIRP